MNGKRTTLKEISHRARLAGFEAIVRHSLHRSPSVRVARKSDWRRVIQLEHELFPRLQTPFSAPCLNKLSDIFPYYLFVTVGVESRKVGGYLSMMPLNQRGFLHCLQTRTTNVCVLDEAYFSPDLSDVGCLFLEVIAFQSGVPKGSRRGLLGLLGHTMKAFSAWPILATPVSEEGLAMLARKQFVPVSTPGLDQLYILYPQEESLL